MDFINIIFRFFDFFVIVGLAVYGFKHYIIPAIEKMLREYGVFIYNLQSDCKDLQLQTQAISENIQDQDRQFLAMQAKFVVWQKKCDERIALQVKEQELTDAKMQKRFEVRSEFVKNDAMLKEQLPGILDTVAHDLHMKYRSIDIQKQYIDTLIDIMKEPS